MSRMRISILGAAFLMPLAALIIVSTASAETGRGAGTPMDVLPKSLMGLDIKDYFIPSEFKKAGLIQALRGHAVVVHKATRQAYFVNEGDPVFENDAVHTLAESRCRIRLLDGDVVSMAPGSEFTIDTYDDQPSKGRKTTLLGMLSGKVKFYALRLMRYKETRFAVRTPTAVVGVRGTKFGIHLYSEGAERRAAGPVLVADSGTAIAMYLANEDGDAEGKDGMTVHAMDGEVDVDGKGVPEGYSYKDGDVNPSDPQEVEDFERDTDIEGAPSPGEKAVEEAPDPLDDEGDAGNEGVDDQGSEADSREQQQLTDTQTEDNADSILGDAGTEGGGEPGGGEPGGGGEVVMGTYGYFSAMLTNSGPFLEDVYINTSKEDLSGVVVIPALPDNPPNGITINALSYLKEIVLGGGDYDSGDLGDAHPITKTVAGSNAYLEWGYWTMTTPIDEGFVVNNRAYYVMGEPTPDAALAELTSPVTYTGTAWGTYYSTGGGDNMSGSFSCIVDFSADTITDFNMTVDNGGAGAGFRQAQLLNGGGNLAGPQFTLNPGVGTWDLQSSALATPNAADEKACSGALYGPAAEAVGGVWGMQHTPSGDAAVGGFQGTR